MLEWIRFSITALLFLAGFTALFISIFGTFRFDFALNRIHSAAMVDTLILVLFLLGCAISSGLNVTTIKFGVIIFIQWCTSPLVSHMLLKAEYRTYKKLDNYCVLPGEEEL